MTSKQWALNVKHSSILAPTALGPDAANRLCKPFDAGNVPDVARLNQHAVGALTVLSSPLVAHAGSAWVVNASKKWVLTAGHVARAFSYQVGSEWLLRRSVGGQSVDVRLSFSADPRTSVSAFKVARVLACGGAAEIDLALLEVEGNAELPRELVWVDVPQTTARDCLVIGYPLVSPHLMWHFRPVFESSAFVKRWSAGRCAVANSGKLNHDATTLLGSSGSPVIDQLTGCVLGLHCAGEQHVGNLAIAADICKRWLSEVGAVSSTNAQAVPLVLPAGPGIVESSRRFPSLSTND